MNLGARLEARLKRKRQGGRRVQVQIARQILPKWAWDI